jgi:hypothetical protein
MPKIVQTGHLIRRLTLTLCVRHAAVMGSRATNVMRQGLWPILWWASEAEKPALASFALISSSL